MEKAIHHLKNCIAEILNYLIFVIIELVIFTALNTEWLTFIQFSILALNPLYFYFIRCKVPSLWKFITLHLVPLGLIWLISLTQTVHLVVLLFVLFIQIIISFNIKVAAYKDPERDGYGTGVVFIWVAISLAIIAQIVVNGISITILTILFVAFYFIHLYIDHFLFYTKMSRRTTGNVPEKAIFTSNLIVVGSFILISILIMAAASARNYLIGFGRWLGFQLVRFINWIFSLWTFEMASEDISTQATEDIFAEIAPTYDSNPIMWLVILENIILIIISLLIIAWIIRVGYKFGAFIIEVFERRVRANSKFEENKEGDIIEKIKQLKRGKKEKHLRKIFRTNNEKIRWIFAKIIEKEAKKSNEDSTRYLLSYATARELMDLFAEGPKADNGDADAIIRLYEKARYTSDKCTITEVKMAKKLASLIK